MLGTPDYRTVDRMIGVRFSKYGWKLYGNGAWKPIITLQERDEIWEAWIRRWK